MVKFINNIICYSITNVLNFKKISQEDLLASLKKTDKEFTLKLYKDSITIASKIQIHFFYRMQLILSME